MSNEIKLQRSRMMIAQKMLNKNYVICFKDTKTQRNFCYPVDAFHDWLKSNTNCLNTSSWIEDGIYNWHYVPQKYFDFLDDFAVTTIPEETPISDIRDYRPNERVEDLIYFRQKYGHCYVYDIPEEALDEEAKRRFKGLKAWVNKKRKEYLNYVVAGPYGAGAEENVDHIVDGPVMDEAEVEELSNIGFIFYSDLGHYFKTGDNEYERNSLDHDRNSLIATLNSLNTHKAWTFKDKEKK